MLGVVEVIRLGGGKEDLLDALAKEELRQEGVPTGPEGAEDVGHGLAEVLDGLRTCMDRAKHVYQNDLAVDPGEVVAEEGFDYLALVGLEAAGEFAPERAARRIGGRQRRKGQDRRARHVAGQEEASRRAIGIARGAGGLKIAGESLGQRLGGRFVEFGRRIGGGERGAECGRLGARLDAFQNLGRPVLVAFVEEAEVEKPFAGIVDDVEMKGPGPGDAGKEARGLDAEGEAQFADPARAFGPDRRGTRHGREMGLVVEARHRVVGLGLKPGGADTALGGGPQRRHAAPVD